MPYRPGGGRRAAGGGRRAHQLLLHAVELPHAHRAVARGGGELAVVRVNCEAVDDVRVRAQQGHVLLRRHVQHADGAGGRAHKELQAVRRGVRRGDGPLVLGLQPHATKGCSAMCGSLAALAVWGLQRYLCGRLQRDVWQAAALSICVGGCRVICVRGCSACCAGGCRAGSMCSRLEEVRREVERPHAQGAVG